MARQAVELDPRNIRALQAEMFALYFSKELMPALRVGSQALAINPNDTELMGEYGYPPGLVRKLGWRVPAGCGSARSQSGSFRLL